MPSWPKARFRLGQALVATGQPLQCVCVCLYADYMRMRMRMRMRMPRRGLGWGRLSWLQVYRHTHTFVVSRCMRMRMPVGLGWGRRSWLQVSRCMRVRMPVYADYMRMRMPAYRSAAGGRRGVANVCASGLRCATQCVCVWRMPCVCSLLPFAYANM